MSTNYNPRIVTDGLVLALDAANSRSYSGTGTTWSDLSGNGNTGTLTNGPTYNSANGGSIVFDGLNDYADCDDIGISSSKVTFAAWIKFSGSSSYVHIIDANSNTCHLSIAGQNNRPYFYNGATYHTNSAAITNNVWYYLTGVQSDTNDIYINGGLSSSISSNRNISVSSINVGRWYSNSRYFNGDIASAQIYNRALTAAEVAQNFNATRGRYGI
tara:strand:+ start:1723 stop:2367 length:645 start_codon:yes stop_codon:yes gene_type:complete